MVPVLAKDIVFVPKRGPKGATPIELEQRILARIKEENLPLTYLGFIGEYRGTRTRIAFKCECGRTPEKCAKNFLLMGSVCGCRQSAYNGKFRKGDVYLYVMRSGDIGKVGVTSDLIRRRQELNASNKRTFDIIYTQQFPKKQDAFDKERFIKKEIIGSGAGGLSEGYTETFRFNPKTLNTIKNFCV